MTLKLATPASQADTTGKPADATHILMFWPPAWRTPLEGLLKRITRAGMWAIYTVAEFKEGDYCQADEQTLTAGWRTSVPPVIRKHTEGDPGEWTYSRDACGEGDGGLVAERRLTRNGTVADIWIALPRDTR